MSERAGMENRPLQKRLNMKGMVACLLISAFVIGLYFMPFGGYILYPFMLVYTFIHEMGHGIAALLMGGSFSKFEMWPDGSGVATSALSLGAGHFAHAFVAFGGLVAPAVMAAVSMILGRSGRASRIGMKLFALICGLSLIFVVRNWFGAVFVIVCGIGSFLLGFLPKSDKVPQYGMLFLAVTLLTAVFSRGDYLFTPTADTANGAMPSDVGQIANYLFLPYWFWGGLIALVSVMILIFGVRGFFYGADAGKKSEKQSLPPDGAV